MIKEKIKVPTMINSGHTCEIWKPAYGKRRIAFRGCDCCLYARQPWNNDFTTHVICSLIQQRRNQNGYEKQV